MNAANSLSKYILFLFLSFCGFSLQVQAQSKIYVNEYLNIGVGGRSLALSGASVASTNDGTSSFWNPAGLMQVKTDVEINLMHAEYFSGLAKYDFGSVVKPLKSKNKVIALSLIRFAVDDIPNTIDFIQPDGSFDESKLKSMTAGDYALLLSYAQKINLFKNQEIKTSIGCNTKFLFRHLGSLANAWGCGIDVGFQASYKQWAWGVSVKDITTTYTAWSFHLTEREQQIFNQTGNEIPIKSYEVMLPRVAVGVAKQLLPENKSYKLWAEIAADITTDGKRNTVWSNNTFSLDPKIGVEGSYKKTIFLRAGIGNFQQVKDDRDTNNRQQYLIYQPSIGAGLKLNQVAIDYAFTSLQIQSNPLMTHIISMKLLLTKKKKLATSTIAQVQNQP